MCMWNMWLDGDNMMNSEDKQKEGDTRMYNITNRT
jgi:hypothetical protein